MQYYSIKLDQYQGLPRDSQNRKYLTTDQFKTEKSFGLDTIIFPADVEKRIDMYVKLFRPVLAKEAVRKNVSVGNGLFLATTGKNFVRLSQDVLSVFQKVRVTSFLSLLLLLFFISMYG